MEIKSIWTDDLTKCRSCKKGIEKEAVYFAFPKMNDGSNGPDPWPLCEIHGWPHALIAGWKPIKIEEYKANG